MQPKFIQHEPKRVYSKACVCGDFIFLAGEDCKDPKTQAIRGTTVPEQFDYTYQNMKATLESLGSSLGEYREPHNLRDRSPRSRSASPRPRQMAPARAAQRPHLRSSTGRSGDAGRDSGRGADTGQELIRRLSGSPFVLKWTIRAHQITHSKISTLPWRERMDAVQQRVLNEISQDELVAMTVDLVNFYSPTGGEATIGDYLAGRLKVNLGCACSFRKSNRDAITSSDVCLEKKERRSSSSVDTSIPVPPDVKQRLGVGDYSSEDFGGGQIRAAVTKGWISGPGASNMKETCCPLIGPQCERFSARASSCSAMFLLPAW